jgi:hypothetical protein
MSTTVKLVSSTNRTSEVRRAVENFFRWVKDAQTSYAPKVDVQLDTAHAYYLHLEAPAGTEKFFNGALQVFLHAEGVELG